MNTKIIGRCHHRPVTRIVSLILSIVMLFSITAGLDLSAYALVTTGICGDNVNYSFDSETGTLTISGKGEMWNYEYDDSPFKHNSKIETVIIENGVTKIGFAFLDCSSIKNVTIPKSVTEIDSLTFEGCTNLTNITIPDSVTYIGRFAFKNCSSLKNITIPKNVTYIGESTFEGCSSLTNITIPKSVTSIDRSAFKGCSSLKSINIPENIEHISMYNVFSDCSSLESITVDKNNKRYDSRNNCNAIIDSSSGNLLYGCKNTVIPETATSIGISAFYGCSGLTNIIIPDSVDYIYEEAFEGCSSLKSIIIPEGVRSINKSTFYDCSSLTNVTIPKSVTSIGSGAFEGCISLKNIIIPDSVTEIEFGAFSGCSALTNITIPGGINIIEGRIFEGCTSLVEIIIPDGVTEIGNDAFQNCKSLKKVTFPDSLTDISYEAFEGCSSLSSVKLPKNLKSISYDAFRGCNSLESITIDKNNKVYDSRDNCNAIIETKTNALIYGCNNTVIPKSVTEIGWRSFSDCSGLTSINIPDSVIRIGGLAFADCENLKSITISASVKEIGYGIFTQCNSLEKIVVNKNNKVYDSRDNCNAIIKTASNKIVEACSTTTIPESVTAIGEEAFSSRKVPETMVIPKNVTKIDAQAFTSSTLKDITILNANCNIDDLYSPDSYTTAYTIGRDVVIHGHKNSTAQNYAEIHSNKFVVLSIDTVQEKFADLNNYDFYGDYIEYTSIKNSFLKGTNPPYYTDFSPTTPITRAMFVTILYRMAGEPYSNNRNPYKTSPFTDITDKSVYYYDAACWALKNGITTQKTFKPFDNVSREQTASFLFRYAQSNGKVGDTKYKSVNLKSYPDYNSVHSWAVEALQWANYNGMITGTQQGYINPQGATQRIHATKILYGFGKTCNIGNF